jgi:GntR family transcriptional regulator
MGDVVVEFRVDRASGLPAYRQLVQQVTEGLRLGWLRPGDQLPVVREVVASSGVNGNTVLKAYRELEFAGLVEMRQGSGTFVTGKLAAIDDALSRELSTELAEWVGRARTAGLSSDDIRALLRAVLAEEGVATR